MVCGPCINLRMYQVSWENWEDSLICPGSLTCPCRCGNIFKWTLKDEESYSGAKVCIRIRSRKEMERCCLLVGSSWLSLAFFLMHPRITFLGVAPPAVSLGDPQQSVTNTVHYRLAIWCKHFRPLLFFFPDICSLWVSGGLGRTIIKKAYYLCL